jgi:hypothetical protein
MGLGARLQMRRFSFHYKLTVPGGLPRESGRIVPRALIMLLLISIAVTLIVTSFGQESRDSQTRNRNRTQEGLEPKEKLSVEEALAVSKDPPQVEEEKITESKEVQIEEGQDKSSTHENPMPSQSPRLEGDATGSSNRSQAQNPVEDDSSVLLQETVSNEGEKREAENPVAEEPEILLPEKGETEESGNGLLPDLPQEGTAFIRGEVYGPSGEGLPGVSVSVKEIGRKTRANQQGVFRLPDLPAGELMIQFNKLGYKVGTRTVVLKEGEELQVSQALEEQPVEFVDDEYQMDEVEVVGEYVEDNATGIDIDTFGDVNILGGAIGKAEFSKTGVSDAAGAVTKIAGANVVGGKFVVVRGLGDRYNNTTLNGGLVPSPETSRKAVQLDLFPTDLLEDITIAKTASPSLPADFVGGLVAIRTLREPEEDYLTLSVGTEYDAETVGQDEFLTVPGLDLPNDLDPTPRVIEDDPLLSSDAFTDSRGDEVKAARQRFFDKVKFNTESRDPQLDREFAIQFGKTFEIGENNRLSLVGSFTYDADDRYRREEVSRWGGTLRIAPDRVGELDPRFANLSSLMPPGPNSSSFSVGGLDANYERDIYTQSKKSGLLLGTTLELGDNHALNATLFKFKSAEAQYATTEGGIVDSSQIDGRTESLALQDFVVDGGRFLGREDFVVSSRRNTYEQVFRDLQFFNLGGDHDFEGLGNGMEFNWGVYSAKTLESRPRSYELNGFDIRPVDGSGPAGFTIANITDVSISPASSFLESQVEDESFQIKADGRYALFEDGDGEEGDRFLDLVLGVDAYRRSRDSRLTQAQVELGRGARTGGDAGIGANDDILTGDPTVDGERESSSENPIASRSGSNSTPEYTGSTTVQSYYFGSDGKWDAWFGSLGFRVEQETREFEVPSDNSPTGGGGSSNLFPQFQFGRTFGREDEFKAQFSYSKTVVRPTFYEFIPANIADVSNNRVFQGNRDLRESTSENFDFRVSWKGQDRDSVGVTLFQKVIQDPIFTIRDPLENDILTFANLGETTVRGIELDAAKTLSDRFTINGNVSYIEGDAEPGLIQQGSNQFLGSFDRLEGQPTWLANLILSYEDVESGWSANLIYNYTGDYQTVGNLGRVGDPDFGGPSEVRQPFHTLDFNISRVIELDWATFKVKFKIENILDSEEEILFDGVDSSLRPRSLTAGGRSFGLSFEAEF